MSYEITVEGGKSKRLLTAGKYCDRDIVVTATGGGTDLPELTNQGTAADLAAGKELIDSDGNVVTGTLTDDGQGFASSSPKMIGMAGNTLVQAFAFADEDKILRHGDRVSLTMASKDFGDATAEDVAKGKTFTSVAGLKAVGRMEGGGGGTNYDLFNDGDTHVWITLQEGRTSPIMGLGVNGTATIDWGDGTTPDVLTGSNANSVVYTPRHEYASAGDYIIRITASNGVTLLGVASSNAYGHILRHSVDADVRNAAYRHAIKQVELGDTKFKMSTAAFYNCAALERVYLPFQSNSVGNNVFNNCSALEHADIAGKTTIGSFMFYNCQRLAHVSIPKEVESIAASAFYNCYSVKVFDFSNHEFVPSLANVNAFSNIPTDCEFRVPAALYDEWIAATNWSTYASQIFGVGIDDGGGNGGAE